MTGLLIDIVTSGPVLIVLALLLLAALIVAHMPLIGRLPAIAPYVVAAQLSAYVVLAGLMFLVGFKVADDRAETQRLRDELQWRETQLEIQKATAEEADRLKAEADAAAADAKGKLDDYRKTLGDRPDGCAFTPDELRRLRELRRAR